MPLVRVFSRRLTVLVLLALLAGSGLFPSPPLVGDPEAVAAPGAGMSTTPRPEAWVSAATPVLASHLAASAPAVVRVIASAPLVCRKSQGASPSPAAPGTRAPAILRI
jgi:hypothetical protein